MDLLIGCAKADRRVLSEPRPWAKVTSLGDSAVNVTLRCWTDPNDHTDTKFDLTKEIKVTFEAHGLSFLYPHQVSMERSLSPRPVAEKSAPLRA